MIKSQYRHRTVVTVGWASRVIGSWVLVLVLMAVLATFAGGH